MLSIEGNIVNIDKTVRGRIEIDQASGLIAALGKPTGQADWVLEDELIFPGFIDIHVHARECADHSWDYKEDFITAGEAAINGGVVAFADMPNNPVPPVDEKSYSDKFQLAQKCPVDVLLYAGIGGGTKPVVQVIGLPKGGKVPYKIFMGPSIGELFFYSFSDLEDAIKNYHGQNISFHCEDPVVLEANKNELTHGLRRPPQAEISAIDFALRMIEKYNIIGKICHCSTMEGMEKIIAAKKQGLAVTAEVSPTHLFFDNLAFPENKNPLLLMNPPIRHSPDDRLALIEYLKKGDIDFLATDHAPHTLEEKEKGVSGLPQLDTYGPFTAWLMKEYGFTQQDILRVCSSNPGKFISNFLPKTYGKIEPGFAGSLTVIDMNKPITIKKSLLKTKCGWSPFEGMTFPGRVICTIVNGKVYKIK